MRMLSRRQTLVSMLAAGAGIAAPAERAASGPSSTRVSFLLVNDVYRIEARTGAGAWRASRLP